jgi:hypothetical protein
VNFGDPEVIGIVNQLRIAKLSSSVGVSRKDEEGKRMGIDDPVKFSRLQPRGKFVAVVVVLMATLMNIGENLERFEQHEDGWDGQQSILTL